MNELVMALTEPGKGFCTYPVLFFAYLSHLKDSDHQTNFYITQR